MKSLSPTSAFSIGFKQEMVLDSLSYREFIIEFLKMPIEQNPNLSMFFRAAIYSILFLSTEDPSRLHYQAARETLREIGGVDLEEKEQARDLLARALVKECQVFAKYFSPSDLVDIKEAEIFSLNGILRLDEQFASHIALLGPHGKTISQALLEASSSWRDSYVKDQDALALFRLWVDFDIPPYYCRYLKLLAEILWKDGIEAQFEKTQKHLPALTLTVQKPLSRLFSSKTSTTILPEKTAVLYEGKIVAEVPNIEPKYASLLAKGIQSFGSIYHHRLLRYECEMGYKNWIAGKKDPQIIRFDRGETQLAEDLGFKFKQAPAIIKSLLFAQSRMVFHFDDQSSGPLVSLKEFTSKSTSRQEGLQITLSPQLMPHYTFQTDRKGRLLVPLASFPSFVSAPQYHAGQALLQMLIMEEFTRQSLELSRRHSIEIPEETWEEFLEQSGLPRSIFKQVLQHWLDSGFLAQPEPERFALGPSYEKELKFLHSQGSIRKDRQAQAQISVRKRKASIAR